MTQMEKHAKAQYEKNRLTEILTFCVITFELIKFYTCAAPLNDHLNFNFMKYIHVVGEKIVFFRAYLVTILVNITALSKDLK